MRFTPLRRRLRIYLALLIWPDDTRWYERELEVANARLRSALGAARQVVPDAADRWAIDAALTPSP